MPTLDKPIQQFEKILLDMRPSDELTSLAEFIIHSLILYKVKIAQERNLAMTELMEKVNYGEAPGFHFTMDDVLKNSDIRTVIPNDAELKKYIFDEANQTQYTVYLGSTILSYAISVGIR